MKKRVMLVVDDVEVNRIILSSLFSDIYDVIQAENGRDALNLINEYGNDLAIVLLDLVMPVLGGYDVLVEMNNSKIINSIPVILITGENDDESIIKAYGLNASDYIHKPFNPDIVLKRVHNIVEQYQYKNNLEERLSIAIDNIRKQEERAKKTTMFMIEALSTTVEFRSKESGEHIRRVRLFTKFFLDKLAKFYPELNEKEIELIANASCLHDIGKVSIPDAILEKPGKLTPEEFNIMKLHTIKGSEIIDKIKLGFDDDKFIKYCWDICRYHHEKYDGNGYPDKLVGDAIPIWSQCVALADVYDALTSARVYKGPYTHESSIQMIINGECGVFNPKIIQVLLDCQKDLIEISQNIIKETSQNTIL